MELHGYLSDGDRQVEILVGSVRVLTDSRLHLGHLFCQRLDFSGRGHTNYTKKVIQEHRRSENHFPFDEDIWLPWHAEIISYLAVKDAPRRPGSSEPGLCLLLTPGPWTQICEEMLGLNCKIPERVDWLKMWFTPAITSGLRLFWICSTVTGVWGDDASDRGCCVKQKWEIKGQRCMSNLQITLTKLVYFPRGHV